MSHFFLKTVQLFVKKTNMVLVLFLTTLQFSISSYASFDIFSEYHSLEEAESESLDDPGQLDSEYDSDVLTYSPNTMQLQDFASARQAFATSVGSVSSKKFFVQNKLKLQKQLTSELEFVAVYFAQRDYEVDQKHLITELRYKLSERFRLAAYGEPSLNKRENDLGFALLTNVSEHSSLRMFYTMVDFTRRDHNDRPDYFAQGREAYIWGLSFDWGVPSDTWLHAALVFESPTRWLLPQSNSEYSYQKTRMQLTAEKKLTPDASLGIQLQWDEKFEGKSPTSTASTVTSESMQTTRWQSTLQVTLFDDIGKNSWVFGLNQVYRQWLRHTGARLMTGALLPFAWYNMGLAIRTNTQTGAGDRLRMGLETTDYRATGDTQLLSATARRRATEVRANVFYEFGFSSQSRLNLGVTGDLDEATFEGGNAQFSTTF